jgi:hypothetical protein
MLKTFMTQAVITNNKKPFCTGIQRGFFFGSQETNEVIMKHFKVCINYGRKCPAFETTVQAVNQDDAKHQAKVMASMCGFDAAIKKITVQEC